MDDAVLPPSPNWFQVSGFAVSTDGWLIYGGPSKSLCVLEPLPADDKALIQGRRYKAHVLNRANTEKIVSVDISPEWPEKRVVLTGSADGAVKQWNLEPLFQSKVAKLMINHDIHRNEREEVAGVSYSIDSLNAVSVGCNGQVVKWELNTNTVKCYTLIKSFRPTCMACSPHIPLYVAVGTKQGVAVVMDLNGSGKFIYKVRAQDDEITNISWSPHFEQCFQKNLDESEERNNFKKNNKFFKKKESVAEALEASGLGKSLPDDSFGEPNVAAEDDMFDIYKDHAADEFGHKKYQPEDIYVKVPTETKETDFLSECSKLKEEILKKKTEDEKSMQSLVDALDNTHVDSEKSKVVEDTSDGTANFKVKATFTSVHIHNHLLATVGKLGAIRIWSMVGKLVASCAIPQASAKNQKTKLPYYPTLLWQEPNVLLIADGKNQLLVCNPLNIDCKNKLNWSLVHAHHKRAICCIASNAPKRQTGQESSSDWVLYTISQDRNIVQYSLHSRSIVANHSTCGGFVYTVRTCPYDASKVAISVGDGSIRIWESGTLDDNDNKLSAGHVTTYWQNVQGKVLVVAWHPTWENMVAFSTAESRIGLIDVSNRNERPARVLMPTLTGPIYSISWGEGRNLYACAHGELVMYRANKTDEAPTPVKIEVEGRPLEASFVQWYPHGLVCGSISGCVCVCEPQSPYTVRAATIVGSKIIHMVDWHPQQTSNSSEESPNKNLLAVCSLEKHSKIIILEYTNKEDGSKQLQTYKTLEGHKMPVLQLMWNPHLEAQLLSTSQDGTVRVWNVIDGACVSIFEGHDASSLGASWASYPQRPALVLSGAGDCSLRAWSADDYPAASYTGRKFEVIQPKKAKKSKDKNTKDKEKDSTEKETQAESESSAVATTSPPLVTSKFKLGAIKKFVVPLLYKSMSYEGQLAVAKILFAKYLEKTPGAQVDPSSLQSEEKPDMGFIKLFGSTKDVNDILDEQMDRHLKMNCVEGWIMLAIFRGQIDDMIQFANQRDILCPYLISLTPCVSLKYWKEAQQLFLVQLDRLVANGGEDKLSVSKTYGGPVYRKVATLLSTHDLKGAVRALVFAKLFREAYVLCRVRYLDSIAEETLRMWALDNEHSGLLIRAAINYIVLGDLSKAATVLGKRDDEESLNLAASLAKVAGQNLLVEHFAEKKDNIKPTTPDDTEKALEELPSRVELLMKDDNIESEYETGASETENSLDESDTIAKDETGLSAESEQNANIAVTKSKHVTDNVAEINGNVSDEN